MPIRLREAIARARPRVREDAVIEARAALLGEDDRDLLLAVWSYQQPTRMVAHLCGASPRAVRHRIRVLLDRLHSQRFLAAARSLRFLNDAQAELARLHFCQGLSVRRSSEAMGISYHRARRLAAEVRGVIKHLQGPPRRRRRRRRGPRRDTLRRGSQRRKCAPGG